mgnify:CR=1 FL=1|tara:strand:+ start:252 stop:470 length:219 start_codon:yes stop_codon:yes gene_type:complete
MKKVILGVIAISFIGLTSCKKCTECHYEAMDTSGQEIEMELGEYCDDDLETLEANGYQLNDSITVEVHCHGH